MESKKQRQKEHPLWNMICRNGCFLWGFLLVAVCICLAVGCGQPADGGRDTVPSGEDIATTESVSAEEIDMEETTAEAAGELETTAEETTVAESIKLPLPTYSDVTYPYYIEELDITLDIPENLFVYRTKGIRRHWDSSWFRLDCCDWILVTDKEYDEEYLAGDFMENLEEEAKHLVFGLTLTEKELSPLARLCPNVFGNNRIRVTEEWYCEINGMFHSLMLGMHGGNEWLAQDKRGRWPETALPEQLLDQVAEKTLGTSDLNLEGRYLLLPDLTAEYSYQNTMLNPYWWRGYCLAVEELTEHPEKYVYDDEDVTVIMDLMESLRESASNYWYDGQAVTDIYIDQTEDIYLRAYYYANSYAYYLGNEELTKPLEDIIVGFQDWNTSQRSYTMRWADGGFFYSMSDYMVDLQPSYQYLAEHDLFPTGKKEILSIPVGEGEGMVGYGVGRHEGPESVLCGPEAFVVEGDRITVLDSVNQRLLMFEDGQYTGGFVVDACESGGWLYHQENQWIVVSNLGSQVGCIYNEDGTHIKNVPYTLVEPYMEERREPAEGSVPDWMRGEEDRMIHVLGVQKRSVSVAGQTERRSVYYYQQRDLLPVAQVLMSRYICKAEENGPCYYTMQDTADWCYYPLNSLYLSSDGNVYQMECLEDRVVISEVQWEFVNVYSEYLWD